MKDTKLTVHRIGGEWAIRLGQQSFDRFGSKDAALAKAYQWAKSAKSQGYQAAIFLESDDGSEQQVTFS